jgi:uncharacterized damage-inducible protein DinB
MRAFENRKGDGMNTADFLRMFDYDHWANGECVRAISSGGSVPAKSVGRFAHILSAEKLWLDRIVGRPQSLAVWPSLSIDECQKLVVEMASAWREYLRGLESHALGELVHYRNTKGEAWSSRIEDILLHVIMHSVYHRGQIALELREAGFEPASTDFILAVRQGVVE